ncbi:putative ribonuclease H-like domain-containing protein [Tanacetum coccineum]
MVRLYIRGSTDESIWYGYTLEVQPPSYSAGHSTPPSYSSGPSTPPSYSSGPSTPTNYSLGSSRNRECSNCKHLRGKISVLKATMEMHMHPEQHTVNSAALFHEDDNEKKHILAIQTIRNTIMGSTLMATTSIVLCCGLAAVIHRPSELLDQLPRRFSNSDFYLCVGAFREEFSRLRMIGSGFSIQPLPIMLVDFWSSGIIFWCQFCCASSTHGVLFFIILNLLFVDTHNFEKKMDINIMCGCGTFCPWLMFLQIDEHRCVQFLSRK